MKRKTFIIRSDNIVSRLTAFLLSQPKEPLIEVIVQEHKKDRSIEQNQKYWRWNGEISKAWGWSKDEVHEYLKRRFLVRIFERDDTEYATMINSVRKVYSKGMQKDANAMFEHIVKLTSTTNSTVKQFTEYLEDIEMDMAHKGIILSHKEDQYIDEIAERSNDKNL